MIRCLRGKHYSLSQRVVELNTAWLLIFDNVEDMGKVAICIPVHHRGHIIFTTMLQALGGMAKPIDLEKMTLDEGALLIIKTKIAS